MIKSELEKWICELLGLDSVELKKSKFANFSITPGQVEEIIKATGLSSQEMQEKLSSSNNPSVKQISIDNGFINLALTNETLATELNRYFEDGFLQKDLPKKTYVIDYSGPNIAKPFSVGHLRSTVIGQANYNIHQALGNEVIGINHLGDWGTQFGKLIYAVIEWGSEEEIAKDPINSLNKLYVKFHEEAEKDTKLEDLARAWSKKLEDGDDQARTLWKKCVDWSMKEFDRIYDILGVKIDNVIGESFYEDKLDDIVRELKEKKLLKESEGALIVEFEDLPPALIKRQDGATLYMTRDLAALKFRLEKYNPEQIIYHVGQDQQLHFKQLNAIALKLGWLQKTEIVFAGHGMMRLPEGKMSTRKGRVILLNDLIEEAKSRVIEYQKDRESADARGKELELAVSAIKYADLSTNRQSDVLFSFDRLIDLKGNSAIYLQYTYARIKSLLGEFESKYGTNSENSLPEEAVQLAGEGIFFKDTLINSMDHNEPSMLCEYIYSFANKFNSFYERKRIITDNREESEQNIFIVRFAEIVIGRSLDLLGITKFDKI